MNTDYETKHNQKTMKHFIPVNAVLGLVLMASCAVPYSPEEPEAFFPEEDSLLVSVTFSASGSPGTKVTGVTEDAERAIGRWCVFAFDSQGRFRYGDSGAGNPIELKLSAGRTYTCHAICNYQVTGPGAFDPASVRTPADLSGKIAWAGDNRADALLMYGTSEVTPGAGDNPPLTINVKRLVSRIDIRSLKVDFSGKPYLESKTFTLRAIYLTNIYRTTRYGVDYTFAELSATRSAWYNTGGWHRGEEADSGIDSLVGDLGIDTVVSASVPYERAHSFYVFPNPTSTGNDIKTTESWTRRCTRLVIEATIDDDTVYYSIDAPAMERNRIYAASEVTIHGRGSKDPEIIDIDPDIIEVTLEPVINDSWNGRGNIILD